MAIEFRRDGPWRLPQGWVWARLGDVCEINPSTPFDYLPDALELPFVRMAAVGEGTGEVDLSQRRAVSELRKGYTRFRSGDVLFAKITPCMENGKSAALGEIPEGYAAGSTEFHVLRSSVLNSRFLWYWLVRRAFRDDAKRNMSGSAGQLRVPADYLRKTQVPVALLPEQRRIVARIDELFTDVADGETALARARDDLDIWRRALLKAAVAGDLTHDWREHRKRNETGADLVNRLRRAVTASIGTVHRRRSKGRAADGEIDVDMSKLPELPQEWTWSRVGEIGHVTGGLTKNPDRASRLSKLPYLRVANVQYGELDLGNVHEIGVGESELNRLLLRRDDLLIVEGNGSIGQIGRCAIWTGDIDPCVHQNHLIKVRFGEGEVARWAFHWLISPHGRLLITDVASSTSGLHTLSISKIQAIPVPIPPEGELRQILNILAAEADNESTVEAELGDGSKSLTALRQSILKAAFEGCLVEQDPSDEPAQRLLARLDDSSRVATSSRRIRPDHRRPMRAAQ